MYTIVLKSVWCYGCPQKAANKEKKDPLHGEKSSHVEKKACNKEKQGPHM